jgi:diguanylate cyclase (GGDEF)-like protein
VGDPATEDVWRPHVTTLGNYPARSPVLPPAGRADRIGTGRDRAAELRDGAAHDRDGAAEQRDHNADTRDTAADGRDRAADARDRAAEQRDSAAERSEHHRGATADSRESSAAARRDAAAARRDAASDRRDASSDRRAGAGERRYAGRDRGTAAGDRGAGADDRARGGEDRDASTADRGAAAAELLEASYDGLTGVYRRAAGIAALEREMNRARREGQPLMVAFLDVDGLKEVNDLLGHAAGDRLLVTVAAALRGQVRPYDAIIRWGGDEFVCVQTGANRAATGRRLARLNRVLAASAGGGSVSFGLAELRADDAPADLVARADTALYRGRKRRAQRR